MEEHIIRKSGTLAIKRDLSCFNTKKKHFPKKENKGEVGHSCSFKEGDVPWILKKYDILWGRMLYWV